jgi:hypothetical protein
MQARLAAADHQQRADFRLKELDDPNRRVMEYDYFEALNADRPSGFLEFYGQQLDDAEDFFLEKAMMEARADKLLAMEDYTDWEGFFPKDLAEELSVPEVQTTLCKVVAFPFRLRYADMYFSSEIFLEYVVT